MVVSQKFFVGFNLIDKNREIKDSALLSFFGDMAGIHSAIVGDPFGKSMERWVLTSYNVNILRRPKHGETVEVRTWSVGYRAVQAVREFEILSAKGEKLVVASSIWALVNIETKKIIKLTDEKMTPYKSETNKSNFSGETERLIMPGEGEFVDEIIIDWRYIDLNNHMNNTFYLDIAGHALPSGTSYNGFMVSYKKEIKEGTKVALYYLKEENCHFVAIRSAEENEIFAIVKFK